MATVAISNRLHFIWFGKHLPDFAHVAIRSALKENPGSTAILWHGDEFESFPETRMLANWGLEMRTIVIEELVAGLSTALSNTDRSRLLRIYRVLRQPAARANLVRLIVLTVYGGVYLDTDTLTVRDLSGLRSHAAFCGEERILWPSGTSRLDPRPLALGELRRVCSMIPGGFRMHRALLGYYSLAANNAVMGSLPAHPFLLSMFEKALDVPAREWTRRFRFGTHLLQETLREYEPASRAPSDQIEVLSPDYFYPLGPEVSKHYFKKYSDPRSIAAELLAADTHVIHWYASVANLQTRGYEHIRASRDKDVYSYLCERHVAGAPATQSSVLSGAEPVFSGAPV